MSASSPHGSLRCPWHGEYDLYCCLALLLSQDGHVTGHLHVAFGGIEGGGAQVDDTAEYGAVHLQGGYRQVADGSIGFPFL